MTYKEGEYIGQYENDFANGYGIKYIFLGICNYRNGDSYDGNWVDDEMSGQGIYINRKYRNLQISQWRCLYR